MGALYEDVESFFGDIFAWFGRFLARYPIVFIVVSLITSLLMGFGLLNITYETRVEKLYTPARSQALVEQSKLTRVFPDQTRDSFFEHQLVGLGTFGHVIFRAKTTNGGENILNAESISEIKEIHALILEISLDDDSRGHIYRDLCATRNGSCVIDGLEVFNHYDESNCLKEDNFTFVKGKGNDVIDALSDVWFEQNCTYAKAFRLKYNLMHDTEEHRHLSILWQRKFLAKMADVTSQLLNIDYSVSESLDIELADNIGLDTAYFSLTICIMVFYASLVSTGGDWVSTRILLGWAGIAAALLAILASFGLLSLFGLQFVDICGVMPFLILGLGVDDMFILMAGFRQTDIRHSISDRISETYRSSAISVTITSLTDILAFCIGITSPFKSIRNFCVFAGVAIFICYINQLTFFGGCLVLHARRVASSRHCVTCLKTRPKRELEEKGKSKKTILFCYGETPKKARTDESLCEKIPTTYLPKLLMNIPSKVIVFVLFIVYITLAIIGASKLQTGLKLEKIVPESSYLARFIDTEHRYYPQSGPFVMFVVTSPVEYHKQDVQKELGRVLDQAADTMYSNKQFQISWIKAFNNFVGNDVVMEEHYAEFIKQLRKFLNNYPVYKHDLVFNEDTNEITSSRFYVRSLKFINSSYEAEMMNCMRFWAANSTLPMMAYSPYFIFYEHYVSVLKDTLLAVGIAMIGMLFIALAFIPHPISIGCVLITMVSIVVGMCGFMYFWHLELSAITSVQIILSVGFCVDFTVHISHAFMAASGKNRNLRVSQALKKVGVPILNGAVSSVLGILMLAFATSYVYTTFFQTMLLVILLGLGHALLLLPVVLSFVGPRRTGKPRIFISSDLHTTSVTHKDGHYTVNKPEEHDDATQTDPDWQHDTDHEFGTCHTLQQNVELLCMESPERENANMAFPLLQPQPVVQRTREPEVCNSPSSITARPEDRKQSQDSLKPPRARYRRNSATQVEDLSELLATCESHKEQNPVIVTSEEQTPEQDPVIVIPKQKPDTESITPQQTETVLVVNTEQTDSTKLDGAVNAFPQQLAVQDLWKQLHDVAQEPTDEVPGCNAMSTLQADVHAEQENAENESVEQQRCVIQ